MRAVGEPGRVDSAVVNVVLLPQRGERGVYQLQIPIAIVARLYLPAGIAIAARQSLKVDDDCVGPRLMQPYELKVLRIVAVAVEGENQRQLARRRRLGGIDDRGALDPVDRPCDVRRGCNGRVKNQSGEHKEGPAEAGPYVRLDEGPAKAGPYVRLREWRLLHVHLPCAG